jgi:triacylglycerol lipase
VSRLIGSMTTLPASIGRPPRRHLLLVPGFAGFDAIGQLRYYAGVSEVFAAWQNASGAGDASIDYFENSPTASVALRAQRLRRFLAKKLARGLIALQDEVILVGHSTGGLDIRRLLSDLRADDDETWVDGTMRVPHAQIRGRISRIVFLSVPHYGTNIADYVMRFDDTLQSIVRDAASTVSWNREPVSKLRRWLPTLSSNSHLLLALADALDESDATSTPTEAEKSDEREARAELAAWLEQMSKDLSSLADLRSYRSAGMNSESPAHYGIDSRQRELDDFASTGLQTRSYVTRVSGSASALLEYGLAASKLVAWPLELRSLLFNVGSDAWYLPLVANTTTATRWLWDSGPLGAAMVWLHKAPTALFELAYAACADPTGPFVDPAEISPAMVAPTLTHYATAEIVPRRSLSVRDNDGIVNSLSMLWPYDARSPDAHTFRLVQADHADVMGHYSLRKMRGQKAGARRYYSYDLLQRKAPEAQLDIPVFGEREFERLWRDVFAFAFAAQTGRH